NSPMRMPGAWGGSTGRASRPDAPTLAQEGTEGAAARGGGNSRFMAVESTPSTPVVRQPPFATCYGGGRKSWPRLSAAADAVLETGELFDTDRAARVQPAGGDADLPAEAELTAIGKLRRSIMQDDRRIHLAQKLLRRRLVLGDDRVGVMRAVALDMSDRGVDAVDHARGQNSVEILGAPIGLGRRL